MGSFKINVAYFIWEWKNERQFSIVVWEDMAVSGQLSYLFYDSDQMT